MKKLFRKNQEHRDRRATSDVTWRVADVRSDNARAFSGLMSVFDSKEGLQGALRRLGNRPKSVNGEKLEQVVRSTKAFVDKLESIAFDYRYIDLRKRYMDIRRRREQGEEGRKIADDENLLIRQGIYDHNLIRSRTESAMESLQRVHEAIRKSEPSRMKRLLRALVGKKTEQPTELLVLMARVNLAQESLNELSRALGVDQVRRELVKQNPELQLAYSPQ
jgi:hypothetical protein